MSSSKSSSMTLNDAEKSCVAEKTETARKKTADKNAANGRDGSSGSNEGVRERVLKEVGITSSAFIGPAFPPVKNTVKCDIEDSLSEFYKELEKIEPVESGDVKPEQHDAGRLRLPEKIPPCEDRSFQNKIIDERDLVETDGKKENAGRKQPWPHWYHNEPYHNRRPRPDVELNPGGSAPEQSQWNYAPPPNRPPDFRFHAPSFPPRPPSSAFLNPQTSRPHMNSSFHRSAATNHSHNNVHPSPRSGFPPRDVSSRASREDFPRQQSSSYESQSAHVGPYVDRSEEESQFREDYDQIDRYDAYDEVWERSHHGETRDDPRSHHPTLVLILMRGLPGSGKSTRARELLSTGPDGIILSTDDYFALRNGYRYDAGLLGAAHEWNQHRAEEALHDGRSPVIIDNTNLQAWEMKPYVKMALDRGYKVEFCEPRTSWKFDPYELERRNKHGVQHDKIAQMLDRFVLPISVDAVMNSQDPPHVSQRRRQDQAQWANDTQDFRWKQPVCLEEQICSRK